MFQRLLLSQFRSNPQVSLSRRSILLASLVLALAGLAIPLSGSFLPEKPRFYVTLDSANHRVPLGSSVTLTARFNGSIPGDSLRWSASAGEIQPLPIVASSTERVQFTPPAEAGIYTVQGVSSLAPQHFVEAEILVYGESALILRSGGAVVLTGLGDSTAIDVDHLSASGTLSTSPWLSWVSDNPDVVAVDASGNVTAMATTGSAVITGSEMFTGADGPLDPVRVTVSVATLHPQTVVLPRDSVRYSTDHSVLVDGAGLPGGVLEGRVFYSTYGLGFIGRILATETLGSNVMLTFEPASLPDAFSALRVSLRSPTVSFEGEDGTSASVGPTIEDWGCTTKGPGTLANFSPGINRYGWDLYIDGDYDILPDGTPFLELWLAGSTYFSVEGSSMTLAALGGVTINCYLQLGSYLIPTPVGPLQLGTVMSPRVGGILKANLVGDLVFRSPELFHAFEMRTGFRYQGGSFYPIGDRSQSGYAAYPEGQPPFEAGVDFQAELAPYFGAVLGVGFGAGRYIPRRVDWLELRGLMYGKVTVEPPVLPETQGYEGPDWALGLGVQASLEPLLEDPLVRDFLRVFGIDRDFDLRVLFEEREDLWTTPRLSLASAPSPAENPTSAVVTVSVMDAEGIPQAVGADVTLLAWPAGDPSATPTPIGHGMVGVDGTAPITVPWPVDLTDVGARVSDGLFGAVGWPYGLDKVTIGAHSGGDCDGPDCSPTAPGGPPNGPGGPGGGYGDCGDDGSADYPGSVGGGGVGGSGGSGDGGVAGGSGNNPQTCGSTGDPHLISFDGLRYNFQGAGEFILAGTTDGAGTFQPGGDLEIQVRQRQIQPGVTGAINTAVGLRVGDHTVAIYADPETTLGQTHLYVRGAPTADPGTTPIPLGDAGAVFGGGDHYTVVWADGSRVRVNLGYEHLDLTIYLAEARLGAVAGLMGIFDGDRANDFTTREGMLLAPPINFHQLYDLLGESWRVPEGAQLLDPTVGGGDPTDPSFPGSFPPSEISHDILDGAEQRCVDGGVHMPAVVLTCRYDIALLLTGDPVNELLIDSIIAGHALSQSDIFGGEGDVEVYAVPMVAEVLAGSTTEFTASVHGTPNDAVEWDVTDGTYTTVGHTIHWTAPPAGGTHGLTATSIADPSRSTSISVQVVEFIDLSGWEMLSPAGSGSWEVSADGRTVEQKINGHATWFVGPHDYLNVHATGTFSTADSDDDFMGFVFGYGSPTDAPCPNGGLCSLDFFLFDWRQSLEHGAPAGMTLSRVFGDIDPTSSVFWDHQATGGEPFEVLGTDYSEGWIRDAEYRFDLVYRSDLIEIYIDSQLKFSLTPEQVYGVGTSQTFPPGRFGFYNLSQKLVTYGDFVISGL